MKSRWINVLIGSILLLLASFFNELYLFHHGAPWTRAASSLSCIAFAGWIVNLDKIMKK